MIIRPGGRISRFETNISVWFGDAGMFHKFKSPLAQQSSLILKSLCAKSEQYYPMDGHSPMYENIPTYVELVRGYESWKGVRPIMNA